LRQLQNDGGRWLIAVLLLAVRFELEGEGSLKWARDVLRKEVGFQLRVHTTAFSANLPQVMWLGIAIAREQ